MNLSQPYVFISVIFSVFIGTVILVNMLAVAFQWLLNLYQLITHHD